MRFVLMIFAAAVAASPVAADEFTDTLNGALEAYAHGDIAVASEELEYAATLLGAMKAEALAKFLPEPPPGWTRTEDPEGEDQGAAFAMFGGGTTAAATYVKEDMDVTVSIVADSPMVTGIGGMLGGLAAGGTKPLRIQRTQFVQNDTELQGVVDDDVLVSVGGSASVEDKTAFLEAMDLGGLADF